MIEAQIFVTLKKSVLDPQGETVKSGLFSLGFPEVQDCRVGKFMLLRLDVADAEQAGKRVEEMCRKLLANPVIEEYRFQLREVAG
ncbi:MAG: phosphoribosylformylglycinamidine synthase subunit PurS [Candidatus Methylomirabilota bacterium]